MKYDFDKVMNRQSTGAIKWRESGQTDVLEMGCADMDFASAPEIIDALVKRAQVGDFGYFSKTDSYYKSIIDWNKNRYNWDINESQISSCPGTIAGIGICITAFTQPSDAVLMDGPFFNPIEGVIKDNNRKFVKSQMVIKDGRWEIDFDLFEDTILQNNVKAYVLVNPQNPTGKVYTRDELIKVGEICDKHGVIVISDEVHGNITYDVPHVPYIQVNEVNKHHGIVVTSVTKAYNLQGLCYGILIFENEELLAKYNAELHKLDFDFSSNLFSMTALEAAYSEGTPWLEQLVAYLKENRDYVVNYIHEHFPKIKVIAPQASYLMWLDCTDMDMNEAQLKNFFQNKCKVGFNYASKFGETGKPYARLNFACPRSILEEAMKRIEAQI